MDNIFETASRLKLRFSTDVGLITAEDLWVLPLTSETKVNLNGIAKGLSKELRDSNEDNFVGEKTKNTTILELKLDIVKHVIDVRIKEADMKKSASAKKEQNQLILSIIAKKQNEALENKSIEDLLKMVED